MAESQISKEELLKRVEEVARAAHGSLDSGLSHLKDEINSTQENLTSFLQLVAESLVKALDREIKALEQVRQYRMTLHQEMTQIAQTVTKFESHDLKTINQDLATFAKLCENPFIQALVKGAIGNEHDRTKETQG